MSMCWCVFNLQISSFIKVMAAEAPQIMILRVIKADRVRKLKLSSRPASVDALIEILKEQLELDCDFSLQYEDPDLMENWLALLISRSYHKKPVFIFHLHRIPVLLHRLILFQMCHPQNIWADGLQVLFRFPNLRLMLSWHLKMGMLNLKRIKDLFSCQGTKSTIF